MPDATCTSDAIWVELSLFYLGAAVQPESATLSSIYPTPNVTEENTLYAEKHSVIYCIISAV